MPNVSFRFLHASDFRLDQPASGLAEIPKPLRRALIDAPYQAAERVFSAAISEDVEFLLLSGNLLDPRRCGPRGPVFLTEQFERLADRGINVYWAAGPLDTPDRWPSAFPLPDNVMVFPGGELREAVHERSDGLPLAVIVGRGWNASGEIAASEFAPDAEGLYTIALTGGAGDPRALAARNVHFWALGGRRRRRTPIASPCVVHWSGATQGRRPADAGMFGCSLVHVEGPHARISTIPTSVFQWHGERIVIDQRTTLEDLHLQAIERIETLAQAPGGADLLVTWEVEGTGLLMRELARGGVHGSDQQRRLLEALCEEGEKQKPAVWSVALKVEAPDVLPGDLYKQQSVLGDYLRTISHYQMNPTETVDVTPFVSESFLKGHFARAADLGAAADRDRILREAALLGVDLLSGEDTNA